MGAFIYESLQFGGTIEATPKINGGVASVRRRKGYCVIPGQILACLSQYNLL